MNDAEDKTQLQIRSTGTLKALKVSGVESEVYNRPTPYTLEKFGNTMKIHYLSNGFINSLIRLVYMQH